MNEVISTRSFRTKISYAFLSFSIRVLRPAHIIFALLTTNINEYNLRSSLRCRFILKHFNATNNISRNGIWKTCLSTLIWHINTQVYIVMCLFEQYSISVHSYPAIVQISYWLDRIANEKIDTSWTRHNVFDITVRATGTTSQPGMSCLTNWRALSHHTHRTNWHVETKAIDFRFWH